jgi:predicted nucleic acid-binding Zn ribbon protein
MSSQSNRKHGTENVSDAMKALLRHYNLEEKYNESRLKSCWSEIMGKPIARRTSSLYVKGKVLHVTLDSAPLRHELTIAKQKVLEIIAEEFGKGFVEDVRFR